MIFDIFTNNHAILKMSQYFDGHLIYFLIFD